VLRVSNAPRKILRRGTKLPRRDVTWGFIWRTVFENQAQGIEADLKGSDPTTAEADVWAGRHRDWDIGGPAGGLSRSENRLWRLLNKAVLQQLLQSHKRPERSWPARDSLKRQRVGAQPVFEPGQVRVQRGPRLVLGVDTSRSVMDAALEMFAGEARCWYYASKPPRPA